MKELDQIPTVVKIAAVTLTAGYLIGKSLKVLKNKQKKPSLITNEYEQTNEIDFLIKPRYYIKPSATPSNPPYTPRVFSGKEIRTLYNIPIVKSGPGIRQVVIAIIIAYKSTTIQRDLNTYWSNKTYGPGLGTIPAPIISTYTFPGATTNTSWNVETSLDVQMVAVANPYAKIWVVEAATPSLVDITKAVKYATTTLRADIISCSFGVDEALVPTYPDITAPTPTNQNTCFFVASGDTACARSWPALSPHVTSVGGTTVDYTPANQVRFAEYTWQDAGCGISTIVPKPSYQTSVNKTPFRSGPDLSLMANPNTCAAIFSNGKWLGVGGTSLACPLLAGIVSLATQSRTNLKKKALTTIQFTGKPISSNHLQKYLYQNIYTNPTLKNQCLKDIELGTDGNLVATPGWDLVTGLGSVNANNLVNVLTKNMA
jgi:subtilase family serine protease